MTAVAREDAAAAPLLSSSFLKATSRLFFKASSVRLGAAAVGSGEVLGTAVTTGGTGGAGNWPLALFLATAALRLA